MQYKKPDKATIILGGGITKRGLPEPWVKRRLDEALKVKSDFYICVSAGTTYKPPVLRNGFPVYESVASADYLEKKGVAKSKILLETISHDTIGNAFFSRIIHVENMDISELRIITNYFHIKRTRMIFDWVYSLRPKKNLKISYMAVENCGMDKKIIRVREKKEKESIQQLKMHIKRIKSIKQMHKWIFAYHSAYSYGRKPKKMVGNILKSY